MQLMRAPLHPAEGIITCSCGLPSSDFPCNNCLAWEYVPKKRELSTAIPINEDDAPL
uniref:MBAC1 n=1 Tax=Arundo donax TaxID=35708 RepID=A0A0A9CRP5_ARUDO